MSELDFKKFPVTRYQGSKRKILPWIYENVKDLEFETVLDGFGGTGSVSYLFKKMGKQVTYNDNLKFNYLIGKAIIQNRRVKLTESDIVNLFHWISLNPADDFIERTFKGIYYYRKENEWLDNMSNGIINMNHYHGATLDYKKAIAYYALFQSCLIKRPFNLFHRRNLYIRRNDVERSFGNKVTWETSFDEYFKRFILEANESVFDSGFRCKATNSSIFDIKRNDFDLVYLDPPYLAQEGASETSNYARCYHFLEGIANYNEWPGWIDRKTANLRFSADTKENRFSKDNILDSFHDIFAKFQESKLVLSYRYGGNPSIAELEKLMKKFKKRVRIVNTSYRYALNRNNNDVREVLLIGT